MKKFAVMATVVFLISLLVAGIAIGDDNILENDNTNNIDITTNADADATGGAATATGGAATVNFDGGRTQLPHLQYGTNFLNPGTVPRGDGWNLYYDAMNAYLSADEVERMRRHFQVSDLWNWKKRMHISVIRESPKEKPVGISMMTYWPKLTPNDGDKSIASITVKGDVNWPDEVFIGMAADVCINDAHSDRFAIMALVNLKGITDGSSISLGGAASTISSSGRRGGVAAAGGQLGTVEASLEEFKQFEVLCMNKGLNYYAGGGSVSNVRPVATPPAAVRPQPSNGCDEETIRAIQLRITTLKEGTRNCPNECLNNELLWKQIGDANMDLFYCTANREYLNAAVYAYSRSEKNFLEGVEPSGKRTRDLEGARQILYRGHYNWALAIRELDGRDAEISFAQKVQLGNRGDRNMPSGRADMKR